ncbi:MAG: hypothetical protein FWG19_02690, partial [Methanomassiliicoccaceae archaeon]|nr:hypothetical protein [Methanomassiliicoccaceae archaeon]
VNAVKDGIMNASSADPGYGVLHASNTRMDEIMGFVHRDGDREILHALAELLNNVAEQFPGGEPPFKILLENLWWPGLTMTDDSGFVILEKELQFGNWGLCLDTGHLMNRLGNCREERKSIDDLLKIMKGYPRRMIDRIETVHLHMSLSADYQERCKKNPSAYGSVGDADLMSKAYEHICKIDEHRPFNDRTCTKIIDLLRPEHVTYEISARTPEERMSGFMKQRSLFL